TEDWTIRVDSGTYSSWLGDTYANVARLGLSFQRSQNGGRYDPQPGPAFAYYKRLASRVGAPTKEASLFDGIDTHITGVFAAIGHPEPANAAALLSAIQTDVDAAVSAFRFEDPSSCVPALVRGLSTARNAIEKLSSDEDAARILRNKEQQFYDAINAALGAELSAVAEPAGAAPAGAFAPPVTMGSIVPGQSFVVQAKLASRGPRPTRMKID